MKKPTRLGPIVCPWCDRETPRTEKFCVWCEQALDPEALKKLKLGERKSHRAILRFGKQHPEILDEVEEREAMMTALEDNRELQRQVSQYIKATDT